MPWFWRSHNPRELARYATPAAGLLLKELPVSTFAERRREPNTWAQNIAEAIYTSLASETIAYDNAPFWPGHDDVQEIRQPQDILGRCGTCLDLALLFSGVCLYKGLIPILLVFNGPEGGHALVAVSLEKELYEFNDNRRHLYAALASSNPAAPLFNNQQALVDAINPNKHGCYFAVECTGYARGENLPAPGGQRKDDGPLDFSEAVSMGWQRVLHGKLQYAVDLAIEQQGLPSFSCAPLDYTILGHTRWVKRRWMEWAEQQRPWSPPFGEVPTDDRVASPLNAAWQKFLRAGAWHTETQSDAKELANDVSVMVQRHHLDEPELAAFLRVVHAIPWQGNYELIREKAAAGVRLVHARLRALILESERHALPSQILRDDLRACRDKAAKFHYAINNPDFNRCFLITASDGSGKTFFIDSMLRRARKQADESAILIRLRLQDHGEDLEAAILHEVERVFQIRAPAHLGDVNGYFERAQVRLIVAIEDLQNSLSRQSISLDQLVHTIRDSTSLRSIYWLLTLNDISYDRIATQYRFWTTYGYSSSTVERSQHSGWFRLDELNRTEGLGLTLLRTYELDEHALGTQFMAVRDFANRHLSSPLIALIVLELSANDPNRSLPGLDFIPLIAEFWRQRLENVDPAPFNVDQAKAAVTALAKLVGKHGGFDTPKSMAQAALRTSGNVADLECLQRLSLLRFEAPQVQPIYENPHAAERVHLLFELFWGHHLAVDIEAHFALMTTTSKKRLSIVEERFDPIESVDTREAVAQHVLLLTDARAHDEHKHEKFAVAMWSHFRTSKHLPASAVYFAASKATIERQRQVLLELAKDRQPLRTDREVFAVMHLLLESDQVNLPASLAILRPRTERDGIAFQRIADAELGDYFWYLLKRGIPEVDSLVDWVKCLQLLANCQVLDVAGKAAAAVWPEFRTRATNDPNRIIDAVQEYLQNDAKGAREEQKHGDSHRHKGGEPYFFREYFLRHFFEFLLTKRGLALFHELKQRGWFQRQSANATARTARLARTKNRQVTAHQNPSIDPVIVHQIRKHWAFECANWYRMRVNDDDDWAEFRALIDQLIPSADPDDWELAYFMVRHTGPIDENRAALADLCFEDIFSEHAQKLAQLRKKFRISFR